MIVCQIMPNSISLIILLYKVSLRKGNHIDSTDTVKVPSLSITQTLPVCATRMA